MRKIFSDLKLPVFIKKDYIRFVVIALLVLSTAIIVLSFFFNVLLGLSLLVINLITIGLIIYGVEKLTQETNQYISDLSYRIKRGEQEALIKMPIGILIYSEDNEVQWINPQFQVYFGNVEVLGKKIATVDEKLAKLISDNLTASSPKIVDWGENKFELIVQEDIRVVYLMDVTRYAKIEQRYNDEKLAMGQIFIDNYNEITQSMNDKTISNLNNYITNELSNWAKRDQMFLKRIDEDRFLILLNQGSLAKNEKDNFSVIDRVRERTSKQNFPLTLSIGIAYDSTDLYELSRQSQSNLDLALGRGGDQVVVKAKDQQAKFFGGKTNPMEKRTRVRSRMISQALQDIMVQSDKIFVMGHNYPDMDAIGASLGVRRIAEMNQKTCYIVVDETSLHVDVLRLLHKIKEDQHIAPYIISPEQALEMQKDESMLVMVDHSKPSLSASPELYKRMENHVVVLDHHRRGEEFPDNPMLVYIEPYASSTCELITEMFEYQPSDGAPIIKIEATAMLAGIIVDTQSFTLRTGTRTFDAASYLRSVGADAVMIQRLLKENVDDYVAKSHLVETIEFITEDMAISVGEEDVVYDSVITAQTADTLLSLSNVDAAFVITKRADGKVGISARSLGEINVQVIMEKLGGGGHLSNAATQIKDVTVAQARTKLVDVLLNTDEDD